MAKNKNDITSKIDEATPDQLARLLDETFSEDKNSFLKKTLNIGIPLLAAGAAVFLLEETGLPKYLQNYELAKVPIVREYWGSLMSNLKVISAYIERGAVDLSAAFIGGIVANGIKDSLRK